MKKLLISLLLLHPLTLAAAEESNSCQKSPAWTKRFCKRMHQIWTEGNNDLYLSGYAWHNRHTYSKRKIRTYNERAWGGGFGKGFYDEDGDWHALAAIAFLDSHKNVEPAAGYVFQKVAHLSSNLNIGGGYAILATVRPDVLKGFPFVGIIPWVSINFKKISLMGTYIPGSSGAGNVFYAIGKLQFDLF